MTEKSSGEDSLLPRDALGHVAKAMGLHSLAVQQGSSCPVSSVSRVVYQIAQEKQPTSFGVFFFFCFLQFLAITNTILQAQFTHFLSVSLLQKKIL